MRRVWVILLCFLLLTKQEDSSGSSATPSVNINDADGSVSIKIPLVVSPGVSGFTPQLSISFSSGREHHLGTFAYLQGLSAIYRCPSTKVQSGVFRSVQYDNSDKFCLDGKPLIPKGMNGMNGTIYSTEVESFSHITSFSETGSTTNGPDYWIVKTRTGMEYQYGTTRESKIFAQGQNSIRVWSISFAFDNYKNYVQCNYTQENGDFFVSRIDYVGNLKERTAHENSIIFNYTTRNEGNLPVYVGGSLINTSKTLASISTFAYGAHVFTYHLSYVQSCTDSPLLSSITQCASGDCNRPYQITWEEMCNQPFSTIQTPYSFTYPSGITQVQLQVSRYRVGDFNGDGRSDIYYISGTDASTEAFFYLNFQNGWIQTAAPSFPIRSTADLASIDLDRIQIFDWNGDGNDDLFIINGWGGPPVAATIYLIQQNGTNYNQIPGPVTPPLSSTVDAAQLDLKRYMFADFDGNGLIDLYYVNGAPTFIGTIFMNYPNATEYSYPELPGIYTPLSTSISMASVDISRIQILDVNADKSADIYYITGYGNTTFDQLYLNDGRAHFSNPINGISSKINIGVSEAGLDIQRYKFGDFNGDGMADILFVDGSNNFIWAFDGKYQFHQFSSGLPFTVSSNIAEAQNNLQSIQPVNSGMDPYTDIYYFTKNQNNIAQADIIYISTADFTFINFQGAYTSISTLSSQETALDLRRMIFCDYNGDGETDVLEIYGGATEPTNSPLFIHKSTNEKKHIEGFATPLGVQYYFSYLPITDNAVYTKGSNATFPVMDTQTPSFVVSSMAVSDGVGSFKNTTYHYSNGRTHLQGYGFLGYQFVNETSVSSGLVNFMEYSQDYELHLQLYELVTIQYSPTGVILSNQTTSYNSTVVSTPNGEVYIITNIGKSQNTTDLNGAWKGYQSTIYQFDEYSNQILALTTGVDSYGNYSRKVEQSFEIIIEEWQLGLMTSSNTTSINNHQPPSYQTTQYWFNTNTWEMNKQCNNLHLEEFWTCMYFECDNFGNYINITQTGYNIQPRSTISTYTRNGQFLVSSANAMNQLENFEFEPKFGNLVRGTNSNNLLSYSYYNPFGLLTKQTFVDGTYSTMEYLWCNESTPIHSLPSCPLNGVYYVVSISNTRQTSAQYFDSYSRGIRSVTKGFNGTWIFTDTIYNSNGVIAQSSQPYYEGTIPNWVFNAYDILDRIISVTNPDGGIVQTVYDGLIIKTIDTLDHAFVSVSNMFGQTLQTFDAYGCFVKYEYDSMGNLLSVTDCTGLKMIAKYTPIGERMEMYDPNSNVTYFKSDVLGNTLSKIDCLGRSTNYTYDLLSRMTSRVSIEATTTWIYDTAPHGIGNIATIYHSVGNYTQTVTYDQVSRLVCTEIQFFDASYSFNSTYDEMSRVVDTIYPNGYTTTNHYNSQGYLSHVVDSNSNTIFTVIENTANNKIATVLYGNGISTSMSYDVMSRITGISTNQTGASSIQNLSYFWDTESNLLSRHDISRNLRETFTYDSLNRLTEVALRNSNPEPAFSEYAYSPNGNLLYNSNFGEYLYDPEKPNAAISVTTPAGDVFDLKYNELGELEEGLGVQLNFTSFNKPESMRILHYNEDKVFYYDGDNQLLASKSDESTTHFVSFYQKQFLPNGVWIERCFIGSAAIFFRDSSGYSNLYIIHRDHLSSLDVITDLSGEIVHRESFSAFGDNRDPTTWELYDTTETLIYNSYTNITTNGYTNLLNHLAARMVDANGRFYNPVLARFISPDPTTDDLTNSQNLNRYSYVVNRPLSDTDPTGYHHHHHHHIFHKIVKAVERIVADAIAVALLGCVECAAGFEAAVSVVTSHNAGESWKNSIINGVGTFITYDIVFAFSGSSATAAKAPFKGFDYIAAGTVEGLDAVAQGKSFIRGFIHGIAQANHGLFLKSAIGDVSKSSYESFLQAEYHDISKRVFRELAGGIAHSLGISLAAFDIGLTGLSFLGGVRDMTVGDGGYYIQGFGHHEYGGWEMPFDFIDVTLAYQGLPSATGWTIIAKGANSYDYPIVGGHSLGSLEAENLKEMGFIQGPVELDAVPFGAAGNAIGTNVYLNPNDVIEGFFLCYVMHPKGNLPKQVPVATGWLKSHYFEHFQSSTPGKSTYV